MLDEPSQLLATVNTPLGLVAVTHLPYRVSAVPAIFQRKLEELLRPVL